MYMICNGYCSSTACLMPQGCKPRIWHVCKRYLETRRTQPQATFTNVRPAGWLRTSCLARRTAALAPCRLSAERLSSGCGSSEVDRFDDAALDNLRLLRCWGGPAGPPPDATLPARAALCTMRLCMMFKKSSCVID